MPCTLTHHKPDRRRRQILCALAALCSTVAPTMKAHADPASPAVPAEIAADLAQARLLGRAQLRFFGLLVYEARLWTAPSFEPLRYEHTPFALELQYARKLEGAAIAERSIAEMRRVGAFSEEQSRSWLDLMTRAFPDVVAQDRLSGVHDGAGGVRFFFNGEHTAATIDQDYARLFFGIWLSPTTSAPGVRNALIGLA